MMAKKDSSPLVWQAQERRRWTRQDKNGHVLSYVLSVASLWKHPESKFFFACFTDRTGRRLKRSTKETGRAKAQRIADAFELVM
jgi:hypothetical protein